MSEVDNEPSVELSIVIPVFNEEESLTPLCEKLDSVLTDLGLTHEVIFIDDGSTDSSYDVLVGFYYLRSSFNIVEWSNKHFIFD